MSLLIDRHLDAAVATAELSRDVADGLTRPLKELPPRWLYDARGSELFDEITRLPEYYPTRAERAILTARATEIATRTRATALIELGAGSCEKTRILLDALTAVSLETYVAVDVSESALRGALEEVRAEYRGLAVQGVVADFEAHLARLPEGRRRLVAFLGGTIGNLLPAQRARFLASVRQALRPGDAFLLGTDLVKDPQRLLRAYDDAAGVTAAFDKNVLAVVNRQLDGDFDLDAFAHRSVWDADEEWIEMRLRSVRAQDVHLRALDLTVHFAEGEDLRTEISAKFRPERIEAEAHAAGLQVTAFWTDEPGDYALSLLTPARAA